MKRGKKNQKKNTQKIYSKQTPNKYYTRRKSARDQRNAIDFLVLYN